MRTRTYPLFTVTCCFLTIFYEYNVVVISINIIAIITIIHNIVCIIVIIINNIHRMDFVILK